MKSVVAKTNTPMFKAYCIFRSAQKITTDECNSDILFPLRLVAIFSSERKDKKCSTSSPD